MNYYSILPDNELLSRTAPPYVNAIIEDKSYECCILAAVDEGKLMGYAFFSHPESNLMDIWLEYMYTPEEYRENGIATGILSYAREYMRKRGVVNILCRMFLKYGEVRDSAAFFIRRGFIPLSSDGRLLCYRYGDMKSAIYFELMEKHRKRLPPSFSMEEVDKKALRLLLAESKKTGLFFDDKDQGGRLSRFMVEDGLITAAVIVKKAGKDTLYIKDAGLFGNKTKLNMYPVLLSDVITEAEKEFEEDFLVIIELYNEGSYYGMMQMFNPPEREFFIQEYMDCLKLERKTVK